jgi:hypothetical protein
METQIKAALVIAIATIVAAAIGIYGLSKNNADDNEHNIGNIDKNHSENNIMNTSINLNVVQEQYNENVVSNSGKTTLGPQTL